jgi:two-component sensor histidine kinase
MARKAQPRPRRKRVARARAAPLRDVYHRIKNGLQGIAGLLGLHAARRPEAAAALNDAINQIHALAKVYALQERNAELRLGALVEEIVAGLRQACGAEIRFDATAAGRDWILPERESVPVAMVANELVWNAVRHREPRTSDPVVVTLAKGRGAEALLRVRNRGRLPAQRAPSEEDGLALARSLLPPGAGALELREDDGWVCAELRLRPPAVRASRR